MVRKNNKMLILETYQKLVNEFNQTKKYYKSLSEEEKNATTHYYWGKLDGIRESIFTLVNWSEIGNNLNPRILEGFGCNFTTMYIIDGHFCM
ncbi:MAG: hypothetical protein ACFFKA_05815 [Candidatus Thorarchaeota archaeon]